MRGKLFISALQTNGIAEKDGRLKIDDLLLSIDNKNVEEMTYREVIEALKLSTKTGVNLVVVRYLCYLFIFYFWTFDNLFHHFIFRIDQ